MNFVTDQLEAPENQDETNGRKRLSVPVLALRKLEEISERTGMTKAEAATLAIDKLHEEYVAA